MLREEVGQIVVSVEDGAIKGLMRSIRAFNEARGWAKYHDPRSLVLALCGEAGELAQLFRWHRRTGVQLSRKMKRQVEGEVADILIFLLTLCIQLNIDPEEAVRAKLQENERRFPVTPPESTATHGRCDD